MSTCITRMLLCTSTASLGNSGTPSSKVAVTNELLHERGRTEALLACRSPFVDSPDDEVEDDVSTLVRLSYGSCECRLLTGESTLNWGSRPAGDSKKENTLERCGPNADCERRRDSRRHVAPGRSVVEANAVVVGASPGGFSCSPRPKEAPLRS